jgi:general secretion pathway protein K
MAGSSNKHLVHRVFSTRNSMSFVAIKMGRQQSGPRWTGARWRGSGRNFFRIGPKTGDLAPGSIREVDHYPGPRERGSALLLVLFTIILLSGLITATVGFLKNDVDEYGARNKEFRARQLAESGLAFGIHPMVNNEDRSLLEQKAEDGGMFRVSIASESTRLNINVLLQSGHEDLLESLFARWGVAAKSAKVAVEGMHKYLSSSGRVQTIQATNQGAQFEAEFRTVEEMSLVPEFAAVMEKQPEWVNFFTVWGDGKLDVNLADADMVELVTGVSPATAKEFVKYRWGPDGKPFTLDDRVYNSMDEVRAALGMSPQQFSLVQDLLSLKSAVDRIESTGIIAGYQKTIAAIVSRNTTPIRYFAWQER